MATKKRPQSSLNQPEYTHFVVTRGPVVKIESGWEYKNDAVDQIRDNLDGDSTRWRVVSKRYLIGEGVDPYDDSNWKLAREAPKQLTRMNPRIEDRREGPRVYTATELNYMLDMARDNASNGYTKDSLNTIIHVLRELVGK